MSESRKVELSFTSRYSTEGEGVITVASLEDLEALAAKHDEPLILFFGDDGKLSRVEVYDDYRE